MLGGLAHDHEQALASALAGFMPSTQTLEREAQELAAIIECTDIEFLPASKKAAWTSSAAARSCRSA